MVVARTPDTKVGVKFDRMPMPSDDWISPPVWDAPTFLEEVEHERISCGNGAKFDRELIGLREEELERNPRAALIQAERDYGAGRDVAYAIDRLRERAERQENRELEMQDLKREWAQAEDVVAEVTFLRNGLQDEESDAAIRAVLQRHLWGDGLDELAEALEDSDPDKVWSILNSLQKDTDKWAKRHNSAQRIYFDVQHDVNGGVWIVVDIAAVARTVGPVVVSRVTSVGFIPRPSGCARSRARGRASRGQSIRRRGSRRGSRAPSRGGGDPPGGSDADGSDPPALTLENAALIGVAR